MSDGRFCTSCGAPLPAEARFCSRCGTASADATLPEPPASVKEIVCPSCGIVNDGGNRHCTGCGSLLHSAPETTAVRQAGTITPKRATKRRSGPSKITTIAGAVFVVVVAAAVIFESRNAPVSETPSVTGGSTGDERVSAAVLEEISSLEKTVTADPSNSAALLNLANRLHDAKFYPRAIETYKRYISLEPKEPDPRVDLGICYYEMGDSKTAVKEIESALAIDPKHQMAMFNLGVIYLSSNDVPKAKEWFRRCSELDSTTVAGKRAKELLSNH